MRYTVRIHKCVKGSPITQMTISGTNTSMLKKVQKDQLGALHKSH